MHIRIKTFVSFACIRKLASRTGFTLIETLMAVLILSIALVAPLTIAAKALGTALIAKDQTTAFFLAQDAVEYVRFTRDTNTLKGQSWLTGLGPCIGGSGCRVNSTANDIQLCSGTCPVLNYNSDKGWYTYSTDEGTATVANGKIMPTIFTRTVTIANVVSNSSEESVTVVVSWKDVGGVARSLMVRENIADWQ